jgi:hypothetical protein
MALQFQRHYTRDEARALLPQVRQWLDQLGQVKEQLARLDERLAARLANGHDLGGDTVSRWLKAVVAFKGLLQEFARREIQIKDLDRGLVDFPAFFGGREVFLCWEHGEEDIEYWHDLESGYAGRERLTPNV